MTWPAQVANHISTIADTVDGETMTVHTAEMPVCSVLMLMVLLTFVWWMAVLIMAELKFITTANGAQCVMITGISMTLMWFAISLVSPVRPRHHAARDMAKDLALSGWITSSAMEQRLHCFTVHVTAGEYTTVAMARMQAWSVTLINELFAHGAMLNLDS